MTIQKEEPGLIVAYCDNCGERLVTDIELDSSPGEIEDALDELGWQIGKPETVKFDNDYSTRKHKIEYANHYCEDCHYAT